MAENAQPRATPVANPEPQLDGHTLRTAFDNAPHGIAIISAIPATFGRYLYVNRALCELMGRTERELLTETPACLVHPFDVGLNAAHLGGVKPNEVASVELRCLRTDGLLVWVLQSTRLVVTTAGLPDHFVTQVVDITKGKEQELVLADERRRLRETEAVGGVGWWEFHPVTQALTWSRGLYALFGMAGNDVGGDARAALALVHRRDVGLVDAAVRSCVEGGKPIGLRCRITRSDTADLRWIYIQGGPVHLDGRLDRVAGVAADITDQVYAEEQAARADSLAQEAIRLSTQHEALLASMVEGVVVHNLEGAIVQANPAACDILKLSTDELSGRTSTDPRWQTIREDGSDFPSELRPSMQALHTGQPVHNVRFGLVVGNSETRWIEVSAAPLFDANGAVEGVISGLVDITEAQRVKAESAASHARYQELVANLPDSGVFVYDRDLRVVTCGGPLVAQRGWTAAELTGRRPHEFVTEVELAGLLPALDACLDGHASTMEMVSGSGRQVTVDVAPLDVQDGVAQRLLVVARNVTAQRQAEQAQRDSENEFKLAFETAPLGMAMIDLSAQSIGRLVRVNPAMCVLAGRSFDELCQLRLAAITAPVDRAVLQNLIELLRTDPAERVSTETRFTRPSGEVVWGQLAISVIPANGTRAAYGICLIEDITLRKNAENALLFQSMHDSLTGLATRGLLRNRLEHALAAATRSHKPVGVLYIDLDGFKQVNDTAGHAAGDELLVQVAERLRNAVRPGDTVARLGGDEFAIICIDVADTEALNVAATRILHTLNSPFPLSVGTHNISGSIGLQLSDADSHPDQLLADADAAMYNAKKAGKNRIASPRLEDQARGARAARLGPELHRAVADDELVMFGQPVVDLATGRTVAVETLIRWQHPSRGILPPSEFLDVAESSPLMIAIGQRALRESCRMAAGWCEQFGGQAPDVHVNVSGRQLETGNLTADVEETLARYGLPASRLILELTETHMPAIADSLRNDLNNLRDRGVRIAIDDLGTGYSSLTRITELPVDMLKIDLRFIAGLGVDPACQAVVRAILSLGQEMGLSVVAEGVETPEQEQLLASYGCDTVQGYLYSPPRPELDLLHLLSKEVHRSAEGRAS